jgi:hypothetical protein
MDVILDGTKLSFEPQKYSWKYQSTVTTEFTACRINSRDYFVKRQPKPFSGQQLLVKAISNSQIKHCPRVVSLAKNNGHYYFFTDFLKGDILAARSYLVNNEKLINNLFVAIYNINKLGFWYSDLCLKNIFMTTSGDYYLIDIDSCFPHSERFHHDLNISYDYSAVLVKFGRETGYGICNLGKGHNGECMNQAMLIAIAVDIRNSFKIPLSRKDSVIHGLLLRSYERDYIDLFKNLINGQSDWAGTRKLVDKVFKKL